MHARRLRLIQPPNVCLGQRARPVPNPFPLPRTGAKLVSRSTEDSLLWSLVCLGAAVGSLPASHAAPLLPELLLVVDAGLAAPSRVGQYWVTLLLNGLLNVLTCYQLSPGWWRGGPTTPAAPRADGGPPAGGLAMWVDRRGGGWAPLPWAEPEAAHVAEAGRLVDRYMTRPAAELEAAVCGGAAAEAQDTVAHKQRCQSLVSGLSAILMGLMGRLEDFEGIPGSESGAAGPEAGVPLYPIGRTGAAVGRRGVRNQVAAVLARVIRCVGTGPRGRRELAKPRRAGTQQSTPPGQCATPNPA